MPPNDKKVDQGAMASMYERLLASTLGYAFFHPFVVVSEVMTINGAEYVASGCVRLFVCVVCLLSVCLFFPALLSLLCSPPSPTPHPTTPCFALMSG